VERFQQSVNEPLFDRVRNKPSPQCVQVAMLKLLFIPTECLMQLFVLLIQGDICHGAGVCVNTQGQAGVIELVNGMRFVNGINVCLNISGRANFKVNVVAP